VNLKLFLRVIKARLWIIVLILVGTLATTAVVTMNTPARYTAVTSMVLDFQSRGPFDQLGIPRQLATGYLATQVDIIRSRSVALKVVDSLSPASKAAAVAAFLDPEDAVAGVNVVRPRLAGELLDNLVIRPSGDSQVLNLEFTSPDAQLSAAIADAFAQAYIDVSLELQVEPARRNARWFEGQLKDFRARLEEKQRLLTAFQREKGIVSIDERLDVENRRFQELSSAVVEAQTNRYDVESRQLGQRHPEYLRAIERERSVQASLNRQKQRVLEIQQQRDELSLLARDVENARNTYDQALQQFSQTNMQSQFNGTNIAVLNKAALPLVPSSPDLKKNLVLAVLLGLVFGFGVAFAMELVDRRIRIAEDLTEELGVPLLASL
jgi:polysaccharide biosynthesis transport protein